MSVTQTLVLLLIVTLVMYRLRVYFLESKKAPLPPGPKPLPLVGNMFDLSSKEESEWTRWLRFKNLYGPITCLRAFGKTFILLNDSEAALELLEKRSAIYSSRTNFPFGGKMVGWENALTNLENSHRFRSYRKNIARVIGSGTAVARFHGLLEVEVRRFLFRVLTTPEGLRDHIRKTAGTIILKITYGYTVEPHGEDPLVELADQVITESALTIIGNWLVDFIGALQYVPEWVPGTRFKQVAREMRARLMSLAEKPYVFVKDQMSRGESADSYVSALLAGEDLTAEEEFVVKWSAMSLYVGGADTTVSSIACFYLAMTTFPEVQRKAQEEIDSVTRGTRLPTFADRSNLPYVEAIIKEVMRWNPVAPRTLPHTLEKEDLYNGYRIPEGAMVLGNIWAFTHDPKDYHDPLAFKPERFLDSKDRLAELDPKVFVFGFGRRICPGKLLAEDSVYLSIVQSLAVFTIKKKIENGKEIEPVVKMKSGLVSHPEDFETHIEPRSKKHEDLIRSIEIEHPWEQGHSQALEALLVEG